MKLADRVGHFSESVIREMTRLAARHGAINLGQGMPDFETPQEIKDAACQAIQDGYNQYAITWGAPALREAIAEKVAAFNGIACDPDRNVTVCCGATECMMATMLALVDPGDEVVIFQPFYENYGPDALLSGAKPVWVPLAAAALDVRPRRTAPRVLAAHQGRSSSTRRTTRPATSSRATN